MSGARIAQAISRFSVQGSIPLPSEYFQHTLGFETNIRIAFQIDEAGAERSPPTFAEVAADGVLAIVAGSDTTATTLSTLFWALLSHPTAYRRLQAEVDRYYPPGEDAVSTVHHPRMNYLNAVMCVLLLFLTLNIVKMIPFQ